MDSAGIWIPIILSFVLTALDISMLVYWIIRPRRLKRRRDYSYNNDIGKRIMLFSLLLLAAIFCVRLAISMFGLKTPDDADHTVFERVSSSLLHALQSFSMDENYPDTLTQGRALIKDLLYGNQDSAWADAFVAYIAVTNVAAPIAGGAFIFEILAGIFPQVLFYLSIPLWWKNRYFFTALNAQSVELAKSIASNPKEKHVQIIFTDAYVDDENEDSTELLLTAKALGAICLKDDLLHIPLKRLRRNKKADVGNTKIFLSDRSENTNLQTLSQLLQFKVQKKLKDTDIYVFGEDTKTTCIEDETEYICNRWRVEYGSSELRPRVIPVDGVRNLAQNLFYDLPLFECLYGKSETEREINLTIIGSGTIGTELFLNAYWFGQIVGVKLNINVVSKAETQEQFVSRINYINPDILCTAKENDPLLDASVVEGEPDYQSPYFHFRFKKANVLTSELDTIMTDGIGEAGDLFPLRDTDYFIIAAGSDADNYSIAEKIKQIIGCYHFHEAKRKKTIISYVIYSSALCRTLNRRPRLQTVADPSRQDAHEFDLYMHAFGSMEEMFSRKNILLDGVRSIGQRVGKSFVGKDQPDRTYNYYNERANRSRALHIIYKAFCVGAIQPTLFRSESDEAYVRSKEQAETDYPAAIRNMRTDSPASSGASAHATAHEIAWMEHRRWNAFMRINAFRCPEDYTDYAALDSDVHKIGVDKGYQFLFLKQHPCIVETAADGFDIPIEVREAKEIVLDYDHLVVRDKLDKLSVEIKQPFKVYDYPEMEIS